MIFGKNARVHADGPETWEKTGGGGLYFAIPIPLRSIGPKIRRCRVPAFFILHMPTAVDGTPVDIKRHTGGGGASSEAFGAWGLYRLWGGEDAIRPGRCPHTASRRPRPRSRNVKPAARGVQFPPQSAKMSVFAPMASSMRFQESSSPYRFDGVIIYLPPNLLSKTFQFNYKIKDVRIRASTIYSFFISTPPVSHFYILSSFWGLNLTTGSPFLSD